jgi:putative transposase
MSLRSSGGRYAHGPTACVRRVGSGVLLALACVLVLIGKRTPVPAVGDGVLGFWNGLREVFPETREQRCRVRKAANVLDALSKSAQPAANKALAEIRGAEDKDRARTAIAAFDRLYGAKFPKAVKKITDDEDVLPAWPWFSS